MSKQPISNKTDARVVHKICVYCGSGVGKSPAYRAAARTLGKALAEKKIGLIYGGGDLGLMGDIAHTTLNHGGHVTGIIPQFLTRKEQMLRDVDELIVTQDMHERKRLMFERSDGFVALPGGIGTLEELVEQLTWVQLGRHTKPVIIANIEGFWDPFLNVLTHMKADGFIRPGINVRFTVVDDATKIVPAVIAEASKRVPARDEAILTKF
jgi:uncharacterized protein (TIGR00730 family)